ILDGATQIGFVKIKNIWYIDWVLYRMPNGKVDSKTINPIPVPSYLRGPTRNQHDFKHRDDSTEPDILIRFPTI
ncbi:MAG: hypothetical protein WAM42_15935, partial [Candidatus Nitrosopolaris sp.]